jgi:hypothetical protein
VGDQSANRETVTVTDVNLKMRARTTVAANIVGVNSTNAVQVVALSLGGAGDAANFPSGGGYRVLLNRGGANEEVIFVTSTAVGPNRLLFEGTNMKVHSIGETVELMADVLTVTALGDFHDGVVSSSDRSTFITGSTSPDTARWPATTSIDMTSAESVSPLVSTITITSATGFPTAGSTALLQFGTPLVPVQKTLPASEAIGSTTITLNSVTNLPASLPFKVVFSPGTPIQEIALVTSYPGGNDIVINGGVATYGLQYTQPAGARVVWYPGGYEELAYTSQSSNTLRFSSPIVLQSDHTRTEPVLESSSLSRPRSNGFDYPFRMPQDFREKLQYLVDLIRAAGVRVEVFTTR